MATVKNQTGSLTEILDFFGGRDTYDFNSLNEIFYFKNNFKNKLGLIETKNKEQLENDIKDFETEYKNKILEINELIKLNEEKLIEEKAYIKEKITEMVNINNIFYKFVLAPYINKLKKRRLILENNFKEEVNKPLVDKYNYINDLNNKIEDRKNNKEKWIEIYSEEEIDKARKTLDIINENINLLYGAEGEEMVSKELSKLPSEYYVINNYSRRYSSYIYDKINREYIKSVQVDHIVVGPTGLFLIETKNWSKNSVESLDLFSPVKQLKRHSYAIFVTLNAWIKGYGHEKISGNWGTRKISPKNFMVLINNKPIKEYQYVRILSLDKLNKSITYGEQILSSDEIVSIVEYIESTNSASNF